MPDYIKLECSDGTCMLDKQFYEESVLVRDLVDNSKNWIKSHTIDEVNDEIRELWMK